MKRILIGSVFFFFLLVASYAQEVKEFEITLPAGIESSETCISIDIPPLSTGFCRNFGIGRNADGLNVRFLQELFSPENYKLCVRLEGEKAAAERSAIVWVKSYFDSKQEKKPPLPPRTFQFWSSSPHRFRVYFHQDTRGKYEKAEFVVCRVMNKVSGLSVFSQIFPLSGEEDCYPMQLDLKYGNRYGIELLFSDRFGRVSSKAEASFSAMAKEQR